VTFTITNVHVTDPPGSSAIDWVAFKYYVEDEDGSPDYIEPYEYSGPFTLVSGGPGGGGWDGYYSGSLEISIYPGWNPIPNDGPDDFVIHLYVKARDRAGNEGAISLGNYYISEECDDLPETPE
jgi:hypothetical protein